MNKQGWNKKTLMRYALLQIPGILLAGMTLWFLHNFFGISHRLARFLFLLWLAKDALMFFFVWPAYQVNEGDGWYSLVGLQGVTRDALRPEHAEGYIRIQGVLWKARLDNGHRPIKPGTKVVVVGRQGIKLTVRSQS